MNTIKILYAGAFAIAFIPNLFWSVPHMVEICFSVSFLCYVQFAYFSLVKLDKDDAKQSASLFTILFCLAGMIIGSFIGQPKVPIPPAALFGAVYGFIFGGMLIFFCEFILHLRREILSLF